jgi:polysaccharide export outer membrane protein
MTTNLQLARVNSKQPTACAASSRIADRRACAWLLLPLAVWLLGAGLAPALAQQPAQPALAQQVAQQALAQQQYLIGPGDILRISVFKNPDLSLDARVSDAGNLSYPLIGSVPVGGLTLSAAEKKLADMLKEGGFVLNPQVNILVTTALAGLVSVLGEVKTPGRFAIEAAGGHLSGMLAVAGGIAPTGADIVIVSGLRAGKPFRREIDIVAMSLGSNAADDILLSGGDTLFVNRAPLFYIYGQVQKPGQVRLERGMTVMQALAAGGGMTGKGTSRGIVRHRRDASGKVKEEGVSLDDDVRDQDVIYVKESLF